MKKLMSLYIIMFLFTLYSFAQDTCKAIININTSINSASIFIDGTEIGTGNATTKLNDGKYEIVIVKSTQEWGSEVLKDSIFIANCDSILNMDYNFEQRTLITSTPNSSVNYKDSLLGHTPLRIPIKYGNLSLEQKGYSDKSIRLSGTPIQHNIDLDFVGNKATEPFIKSTLFKVLVGSAVALGATAAYLKLEADKKFDEYLETRNNNYLNDVDKLDLYSGLAFGVLQINFGVLLYYFLTE